MRFSGKNFLIGLLAGVALTLFGLDFAARKYREDVMLRLMPGYRADQLYGRGVPKTSEGLPVPWVPPVDRPIDGRRPYDNWMFTSLEGQSVRLGDLKGRVVFLTLWATWCQPCVHEMPGIQELAKSLGDAPVSFLMVSDEREDVLKKFLEKVSFRLPVYRREANVPEEFKRDGIPVIYILDKTGAVVLMHVGGANWNQDSVRRYLVFLAQGT